MNINDLMKQPWTWSPALRRQEHGHVHYEIRIAELPDFYVAGRTAAETENDSFPALRAYLESCLEFGDEIPLPSGEPSWTYAVEQPPAGQVIETRTPSGVHELKENFQQA